MNDDLISRMALIERYGEPCHSFLDVIETMPAIDAEPVRHGKWIWNENGMDWNIGAWVCSECGMRNENIHSDMKLNPYIWAGTKYCPNCGARMDGGGD